MSSDITKPIRENKYADGCALSLFVLAGATVCFALGFAAAWMLWG